jgi:hypothetical protein
MFITSRESTIALTPSTEVFDQPCRRIYGPVSFVGRKFLETQTWSRKNLSGLSIYQPGKTRGQGKSPRFLGFHGGFLEITLGTVALMD